MRILIVDDNEPVRRGIAGLLASEKDWQVCGEAENGMDAIQKVRQLLPDLVLLDISMPGLDGLETARRLRQESPRIKILVLSQHDPAHLLPRALDAGANGCLDKSRVSTDLLPAIKSIVFTSKRDSGQ
jgi:DNA-binding NarL/FixJ family response regulator